MILTDKEIFDLLPGYYDSMKFMWDANPEHGDTDVSPSPEYIKLIKAQLKKVFREGELYCLHDNGGLTIKSWACPICRQSFKEEVGL